MINERILQSILFMSKLDLSDREKEEFRKQVDSIIEYFEILKNTDTGRTESESFNDGIGMEELRADETKESFSSATLKSFAIHFMDGYFAVPRILEKKNREKEGEER